MAFFISDPGWRMAPEEFIDLLLKGWPRAKVRADPPSGTYSHRWTMEEPSIELEGRFNQVHSAVVLDAQLPDAARFAVWFRTVIPSSQKLQFYDSGFEYKIELHPQITLQEIESAFGN